MKRLSQQNPRYPGPGFPVNRPPEHELSPDTIRKAGQSACAKDSRRKAASQGDTPAHMGSEVVNRGKIARFQFRVVVQDFLLGHSRCEPTQYIPNCDAEPAHARLTRPFSRLDFDSVRHAPRLPPAWPVHELAAFIGGATSRVQKARPGNRSGAAFSYPQPRSRTFVSHDACQRALRFAHQKITERSWQKMAEINVFFLRHMAAVL